MVINSGNSKHAARSHRKMSRCEHNIIIIAIVFHALGAIAIRCWMDGRMMGRVSFFLCRAKSIEAQQIDAIQYIYAAMPFTFTAAHVLVCRIHRHQFQEEASSSSCASTYSIS
jgi:hypothetical protein